MAEKTKEEIMKEIREALEVVQKPLAEHDGGVELMDFAIESGQLSVRFNGMCEGCPLADQTLHIIIEDTVQSMVPEVKKVVAVSRAPESSFAKTTEEKKV
jgi:Fe-S cluster biogenesis protein NfuA